jgi:hypothetical protein
MGDVGVDQSPVVGGDGTEMSDDAAREGGGAGDVNDNAGGAGLAMPQLLLTMLEGLSDLEVYREVASVLEGEELIAWHRLCQARPEREVLLREAVRFLGTEARRRYPTVVGGSGRIG